MRVQELLVCILLLLTTLCSSYVHTYSTTSKTIGRRWRGLRPLRSTLEETDAEEDNVLVFTDNALKQLDYLQKKQDVKMVLRMGVQAGGCSGMTYVMDFIEQGDINDDDHVESYGEVEYAIDPKSLMFLYGMQLDYSDELIGGGFKFENPNAETSCGCGKSFGV
jgi:iron-sulfur cluster assembly protein